MHTATICMHRIIKFFRQIHACISYDNTHTMTTAICSAGCSVTVLAIFRAQSAFLNNPFVSKMVEKGSYSSLHQSTRYPWLEMHATVVAAFSFLCTGLLRAYTSPAIVSMKAGEANVFLYNSSVLHHTHITSLIAATPPFASFLGTLLSGPVLHHLGRQKTLVFLTLPHIFGWISIGFGYTLFLVVLGRALTGFAAGFATASAQLYVSECVRAPVRGKLGFLPSMMLALGVLLGFLISVVDVNWQQLAFLMLVFPLILLLLSLSIPESPYWLLMRGKKELAWRSLCKLRGSIETDMTRLEFCDMESRTEMTLKAVVERRRNNQGICTLIKMRSIWYPALIAGGLMTLQQLSGANAIINYCSLILKEAHTGNAEMLYVGRFGWIRFSKSIKILI